MNHCDRLVHYIFCCHLCFSVDVDITLMYAIAGTQNYARKSASDYILSLVTYAFKKFDDKTLSEIKGEDLKFLTQEKLKNVFKSLVIKICSDLESQSHFKKFDSFKRTLQINQQDVISSEIKVNFCKILSMCLMASNDFVTEISRNICHQFCSLLMCIGKDHTADVYGLLGCCMNALIKMIEVW